MYHTPMQIPTPGGAPTSYRSLDMSTPYGRTPGGYGSYLDDSSESAGSGSVGSGSGSHRDGRDGKRAAMTSVEIPLRSAKEVIELDFSDLPEVVDDLLFTLQQEKVTLDKWMILAMQYYKRNNLDAFAKLLQVGSDMGINDPEYNTIDVRHHRVAIHNCLGSYYLQLAMAEKDPAVREDYLQRATSQFNTASGIDVSSITNTVGTTILLMLRKEYESAIQKFTYALQQDPENIPALLGKACCFFNLKRFKDAMQTYRKVLALNPDVTVSRYGIGVCAFKLGDIERARLAFTRVLELAPENVDARVALAILDFNTAVDKEFGSKEAQEQLAMQSSLTAAQHVAKGIKTLRDAYQLDSGNSMVLNHLANYFFFKSDWDKTYSLAFSAYQRSSSDEVKALSCYFLAKKHHAKEEYDQAFQFYYQSSRLDPTFALPQFGLGQLYIYKGDTLKASEYFEKVLEKHPDNYETCKILGSLYASSMYSDKRARALQLLRKVTTMKPEDVEAWIELAQLYEKTEFADALECYETAAKLLLNANIPIVPELLNNIGVLRQKLSKLDEAAGMYVAALADLEASIRNEEAADTPDAETIRYWKGLEVTIRYNRARLLEQQRKFSEAEAIYKQLAKDYPTYVDSFLRLGVIARDQGNVQGATEWYREVFLIQPDHPDAWCLLGNMHLSRYEWNLAQAKYEMLLKNNKLEKIDCYPLLALGNIYQQAAKPSNGKNDKNYTRAVEFYQKVLQEDPKNLFAANGLACVMAENGFVKEAQEVFLKVREATSDSPDVWVNLGHVFAEQGRYVNAVKMYTNCLRKFHSDKDMDTLMHLARVHFKFGNFEGCKKTLLHAMHIFPQETVIRYNLALCEENYAQSVFRKDQLSPAVVEKAITSLKVAEKLYRTLSKYPKSSKLGYDPSRIGQSAQRMLDLIAQSDAQKKRAEKQENERIAKEKEREALRKALMDKRIEEEQLRKQKEAEELARLSEMRETFKKRAEETIALILESSRAPPAKKGKGRKSAAAGNGDAADFIEDDDEGDEPSAKESAAKAKKVRRSKETNALFGSSSEEDIDTPSESDEEGGKEDRAKRKEQKEAKRKERREKKDKKKADKKKKRQHDDDDDDDENGSRKQPRTESSGDEDSRKARKSSSKQPKRIFKSKETISSSDEEGEDDARIAALREFEKNAGDSAGDDDDDDDDATGDAGSGKEATEFAVSSRKKGKRAISDDDDDE